jgi:zinc/manganese transport system permease protein
MSDAVLLLWPSFLVALCLVGIHAYFGLQVLARNVIFVDLALAQVAALGATVAFMLGHPAQGTAAYGYSLGFTLLAAVLLTMTRVWSQRVSQEALIGVIYVAAAAAAILLIDRAPQGAEHLKQILTGNILTSGIEDLLVLVPLYAAIGGLHWLLRRQMQAHSLFGDLLFYASFGVVVTSSVAVAGVLLVFSFLIIPAAIGVIFADGLGRQLAIGWIAGSAASAAGLALSFVLDLPTGATMVCTFGASLALAGLCYPFLRGDPRRALRRGFAVLRAAVALLLAASAIQLMALPRADQPLLDSVEYFLPSLRGAYLSASETRTYEDANEFAERYRMQAEQLNEMEASSRSSSESIDDMTVRRLSSFVRSYSEMRKGEEFVMREVRARARERVRWVAGPVTLFLALLLFPGVPRRLRRAIQNRRPSRSV